MNKVSPLQTGRFYRVKKPRKKFLCALCSAPREMKYSKNLSAKNFAQIIIFSIFLSWALFPIMGVKSVLLVFPVWMTFEIINKILYRREIPCPYCGFDATWYRRDVKVANRMVKDFWTTNYPELMDKDQKEPEVAAAIAKQNKSSEMIQAEAHS